VSLLLFIPKNAGLAEVLRAVFVLQKVMQRIGSHQPAEKFGQRGQAKVLFCAEEKNNRKQVHKGSFSAAFRSE